MQINQPKGVKLKMTEHKLRSVVNWHGALKQGIQQMSVKQGIGI
jgi:hypothetical protein